MYALVTFSGNLTIVPAILSSKVSLEPQESLQILVSNISDEVKFVVFQGHHQRLKEPLRMSYLDPSVELPHGSSVSGRDVGLVYQLEDNEVTSSVWLTNLSFETITALVQVVFYSTTGE